MAASVLSLISAYKAAVVFRKLTRYPHIFFTENPSYREVLSDSQKLEKKSSTRVWALSVSFFFEIRAHLGHLRFNKWFCSKNELSTKSNHCVNQFLRKKRHKKWNQECEQKESFLFNFCNIFDILTSRTEKIAWGPPVFKSDFYVFSYNEQLRKI